MSNIAPPWYSRGEIVNGPRVILTLGGKVVDDTALPYEDRLLLSGKSKDFVDKLRQERSPAYRLPRDSIRDSARTAAEAGGKRAADLMPTREAAVKRNKG